MTARRPVLVVTGASRGIGAAVVIAAARTGWDVAVGYRDNADAARDVAASARAEGADAITVPPMSPTRRTSRRYLPPGTLIGGPIAYGAW